MMAGALAVLRQARRRPRGRPLRRGRRTRHRISASLACWTARPWRRAAWCLATSSCSPSPSAPARSWRQPCRAGRGRGTWWLPSKCMDLSNAAAATVLRQHGAAGCTDVTGFGLAGHLSEMARASGVGVRMEAGRVPHLAGRARCVVGRHCQFLAGQQRTLDGRFHDSRRGTECAGSSRAGGPRKRPADYWRGHSRRSGRAVRRGTSSGWLCGSRGESARLAVPSWSSA